MGRRSTVLGSVIAAATVALSVGPAHAGQPAPGAKNGHFYCHNLQISNRHFSASGCVPLHHGRLTDFVVHPDEPADHSYRCAEGWAEGQRLRGDGCFSLYR
ncbi:hypothetical protein DZF91_10180 [Actinomadura logoneensis]|uniref:Secreted protein n=1 Tax=Actinomadura logoneensis TaxID=2293572 RepID=A0A372JNZ5_9ACTN|nr:hypothetical protein [Actinomadura logoneensis]RFU41751.1 hypothetical protein DZF91_10180 [Actinomadura logoneensis]